MKRALLPYMPDGLMTAYRVARERLRDLTGRGARDTTTRTNTDVVVPRRAFRRWLLATPATTRVIADDLAIESRGATGIWVSGSRPSADLEKFLGWEGAAAIVSGSVTTPKWGRQTSPLHIEPVGIYAHPSTLEDIGPPLPQSEGLGLQDVVARLSSAGHRLVVVPTEFDGEVQWRPVGPIERDLIVILAAVPLHDVGGGSRGSQLAFEYAASGRHVVYVNRFPTHEEDDLGIHYVHPYLEQYTARTFDPDSLIARSRRSATVIVELPDPGFDSILEQMRGAGWTIVCDMIDDWSDPALGGEWYDATFEHRLIETADIVTASAPSLIERAHRSGRPDAALVPNAVNSDLFDGSPHDRPGDLPSGDIVGYHGSLYGDWIDWHAIASVATDNPEATVALIGEARNVPSDLPDNVAFLGLKPQTSLPAYVQHFTIGIVPFVVSTTTQAVSPLKVFEYLAEGVPVAAPPLEPLQDLTGVHTSGDIVEAVRLAMNAPRPDGAAARLEHSWGARIATIDSLTGISKGMLDPPHRVRVVLRPFTTYRWRERTVG